MISWSNKLKDKLPVKLEVAFTKIKGCDPNGCEYIRKNYNLKSDFNEMETFKAKYVAVVDSYKRASSKLLNYLFSKSVMFVSSIFEEWFSSQLQPWQHYIPFGLDFSDLEKNIQWAFKNQNEAQKISLRSQIFSHKHLNIKAQQCYMGLLILEYSELLI